jgi:serine phosphatase RsbU (regulator of sigma subunit)
MVPLASLFVARLDPGSGKLEYCSAGHPPALLLRANGDVELLSDGGLLLGVVAAAPYVRGTVELGPGDVLLAYSDGVLESLNKSEEEFGPARLEDQLRRATLTSQSMKSGSTASISAENVLFSVLAAVQDFAATHPIVDDMSLVIIRRDAY